MKLRSALLATAMIALPMVAANAQAISGLYMGGGAGLNAMQRENWSVSGNTASLNRSGSVRSDLGPVVVLSLGWGFGNGLRAEVEASYRQNNGFNNPRGFGGPGSAGGNEQKVGGMANVLYDFTFGMTPMIQPYVGVGVGYQRVIDQNLHEVGLNGAGFAQTNNNGRGAFAYQAILGAAYPIQAVPGLAVTAEYRFMGLAGNTRSYSVASTSGPGTGKVTTTDDFNHSILVGFRYAFNQAPPPAAPMPMDVGEKTFQVFFDWNRADLTGRSQQIVQDAASYSTHTKYTRIDVDGNADTSGTPTYNQGLSERRARVVAAELVRDGVPQGAINMQAFGDTKLLVPTGPGVREPQNRRVDIIFH